MGSSVIGHLGELRLLPPKRTPRIGLSVYRLLESGPAAGARMPTSTTGTDRLYVQYSHPSDVFLTPMRRRIPLQTTHAPCPMHAHPSPFYCFLTKRVVYHSSLFSQFIKATGEQYGLLRVVSPILMGCFHFCLDQHPLPRCYWWDDARCCFLLA
jgi:hypothetical protein